MTNRMIAIGDIHGCCAALGTLIGVLAPGKSDTFVTLGDYIDHGPNTAGVIDHLIELAFTSTLVPLAGNHEEMLFSIWEGRSEQSYWLGFGGDRTLESYGITDPNAFPKDHITFLRSCRLFHETDSTLFVHAGYWPNLPLSEQPLTALLWEPLLPDRAARHYSGKTAIVGHTPQRNGRILDLGFVKCIDTNCYKGGWLTALEAKTGHYWQANEQGHFREGILMR